MEVVVKEADDEIVTAKSVNVATQSKNPGEKQVSHPVGAGSVATLQTLRKLREIGPHDYVNLYTLLNFQAVGELSKPLPLFNLPPDWDEIRGSLTRRKRELKAELVFNDGCLSWLPELQITDEVVHRVLSDLNDSGWHPHHWAVFRMPLLNRFLMHGELGYFFSSNPFAAEFARAGPNSTKRREFIEFISPFFRHRWSPAIKRLLDAADYARATELFAKGVPVTDADFDEALEPVRRHFAQRRETLKQFEDAVESASATPIDTQLQLAIGEAKLLNVLPTHLIGNLSDDMCFAYRSISIELANHRQDFTAAERALTVAEGFRVSDPTRHYLAQDRTTLIGLLQREQEEKRREQEQKQREQELSFRVTVRNWWAERRLQITPEKFTWGAESITVDEMNGIRFGITIKSTNGVKTGVNSILALHSINGTIISTNWLDDEIFETAVRSVMGLYAPTIMEKVFMAVVEDRCQIGPLRLSLLGIAFQTGFIFTKQHFVPWPAAEARVASGEVHIFSRSDHEARTTVACREHWNACLLPPLIEIVKSFGKQNELP